MAIPFCLSIRSFVGSFVRLSLANKRVLMAAAAYHVGHGHLGRTSLCCVTSILSGSKLAMLIDVEGGVSEAFAVSPTKFPPVAIFGKHPFNVLSYCKYELKPRD